MPSSLHLPLRTNLLNDSPVEFAGFRQWLHNEIAMSPSHMPRTFFIPCTGRGHINVHIDKHLRVAAQLRNLVRPRRKGFCGDPIGQDAPEIDLVIPQKRVGPAPPPAKTRRKRAGPRGSWARCRRPLREYRGGTSSKTSNPSRRRRSRSSFKEDIRSPTRVETWCGDRVLEFTGIAGEVGFGMPINIRTSANLPHGNPPMVNHLNPITPRINHNSCIRYGNAGLIPNAEFRNDIVANTPKHKGKSN